MRDHLSRPRIAITMGDAAGIGPEIVVRALAGREICESCRPVVLGHPEVLRRAADRTGLDVNVHELGDSRDWPQINPVDDHNPSIDIPCIRTCADDVLDVPMGKVDARSAQAAYDSIVKAVYEVQDARCEAIVTAPISKHALQLAGHNYPGHTELLADLCHVDRVAMMLYLPPGTAVEGPHGLGVVHATLHIGLRDAIEQLNIQRIVQCFHLADNGMRRLGVDLPRIAVCALNPHGGECGLFGDEEKRIISPAVWQAAREGVQAIGPLPADVGMVAAHAGNYDAVVAMYHDQGHIALKLLGRFQAVNITLGLPVIRTSPAHGTAMDIASKYCADAMGMRYAIHTAVRLAESKL